MAFIDELKEKTGKNKDMAALFRLTAAGGSEFVLVMKKRDKKRKDKTAKAIFDISKKYPVETRLSTIDLEELKNDSLTSERITREAELISGEMPEITLKQLNLKPFVIINYSLTNLNQGRKMQLKRDLYGQKTTKKYKGKAYTSEREGALTRARGRKLGRGSIIIPQQSKNSITNILRKNNVIFEIVDVWL